jgi:hypothetical protein
MYAGNKGYVGYAVFRWQFRFRYASLLPNNQQGRR